MSFNYIKASTAFACFLHQKHFEADPDHIQNVHKDKYDTYLEEKGEKEKMEFINLLTFHCFRNGQLQLYSKAAPTPS